MRPMVTTSVRAWFGRDEGPPTSGVSPIRGAPENALTYESAGCPSRPRPHDPEHDRELIAPERGPPPVRNSDRPAPDPESRVIPGGIH